MSNVASKYSLQSSVGTTGTERGPTHIVKRQMGLPDLNTIHTQAVAEATRNRGAFSPKGSAGLVARDPGHRSHATFGTNIKFSPSK